MARKLPTFLDDRDTEQLLNAADCERDRLILLCGLMCGLRVSEICKLQIQDLDISRRSLFVSQGKGKKDRYVPIPVHLVGPLRAWLAGRQTGFVFPSPRGGRLSTRAVQYLMKRLALKAGLANARTPRRITPHKLRHAYATRLLESGATIYEVQQLLGHSSIAITETYLHTTPARLAEVVDRVYE